MCFINFEWALHEYQLHDRSSLSRFTRCFDQAYLVTFRSKKLIIWITCSVVGVMPYSSQIFGFLVYQVFSRSHPPWDPNVFLLLFFLYDLTCMGCQDSSPSFEKYENLLTSDRSIDINIRVELIWVWYLLLITSQVVNKERERDSNCYPWWILVSHTKCIAKWLWPFGEKRNVQTVSVIYRLSLYAKITSLVNIPKGSCLLY